MPNRSCFAPDFIGIGAAKAGTTWLYQILQHHPQIWMTPYKEIDYFCATLGPRFSTPRRSRLMTDLMRPYWRRLVFQFLKQIRTREDVQRLVWWLRFYLGPRNDRWYGSLFRSVPTGCVGGEISPGYMRCREPDIRHMHALAPTAKLLFLIRDPVQRFWSEYTMYARGGILDQRPAVALNYFNYRGKRQGEYLRTLCKYTQYFRPEQILVIFYDAIAQQPARLLAMVHEFLGVRSIPLDPATLAERVHAASHPLPCPEAVRARVSSAYRPQLETLARLFGGYAWDWLNSGPGAEDQGQAEQAALERRPAIRLTQAHLHLLRQATQADDR